jgi:hypothetical protein
MPLSPHPNRNFEDAMAPFSPPPDFDHDESPPAYKINDPYLANYLNSEASSFTLQLSALRELFFHNILLSSALRSLGLVVSELYMTKEAREAYMGNIVSKITDKLRDIRNDTKTINNQVTHLSTLLANKRYTRIDQPVIEPAHILKVDKSRKRLRYLMTQSAILSIQEDLYPRAAEYTLMLCIREQSQGTFGFMYTKTTVAIGMATYLLFLGILDLVFGHIWAVFMLFELWLDFILFFTSQYF